MQVLVFIPQGDVVLFSVFPLENGLKCVKVAVLSVILQSKSKMIHTVGLPTIIVSIFAEPKH